MWKRGLVLHVCMSDREKWNIQLRYRKKVFENFRLGLLSVNMSKASKNASCYGVQYKEVKLAFWPRPGRSSAYSFGLSSTFNTFYRSTKLSNSGLIGNTVSLLWWIRRYNVITRGCVKWSRIEFIRRWPSMEPRTSARINQHHPCCIPSRPLYVYWLWLRSLSSVWLPLSRQSGEETHVVPSPASLFILSPAYRTSCAVQGAKEWEDIISNVKATNCYP